MHSYFLRAGKHTRPILFRVKKTRDGRSFAARSVEAVQDGETIFKMQCSFQVPEESPLEHQVKHSIILFVFPLFYFYIIKVL